MPEQRIQPVTVANELRNWSHWRFDHVRASVVTALLCGRIVKPPPAPMAAETRALSSSEAARQSHATPVLRDAAIGSLDRAYYDAIKRRWHLLTIHDLAILKAAGIDLLAYGIAAGTHHVEIKFDDNDAWDAAIRTRMGRDAAALQRMRVAAIDPGVRTFLMIYLVYPCCQIRIGHNAASYIDSTFGRRHRALTSQRAGLVAAAVARVTTGQPASVADLVAIQGVSDEMRTVSLRQRRFVDALHTVATRVLCATASLIILPDYKTSTMRLKTRRLSAAITRHQGHLRFHDFRLALEQRCLSSQVGIIITNESYTTACCSSCGYHNKHVGAAKVVRCRQPDCGYTACRDGEGAAKIFKKTAQAVSALLRATGLSAPASTAPLPATTYVF
jgi:hypothetical protein